MSGSIENWAQRVCAGDVRALSRAITAIENHELEAEELLRLLFPRTGKAYLIGVTGAPGTGKSTLVDRLSAHYRGKQEQVGVIAVDPTSPYSGGAILGDRIRMQGHAGDSGMFIRSMATRGFLGGLARATAEVALLLDAAGKQQVLIETVGGGAGEGRAAGDRRHFCVEQVRSGGRGPIGAAVECDAVAGDATRRVASTRGAHR